MTTGKAESPRDRSWIRALLWGFSPALEVEFQTESLRLRSHQTVLHNTISVPAILKLSIFAVYGSLVIVQSSFGSWGKALWFWLLAEQILLYALSVALSLRRPLMLAQQKNEEFLSKQLALLVAWRMHSLFLTLFCNFWISKEVNFKAGWFNLIQTAATTSSFGFFLIVPLQYRITFSMHWRIEAVAFAILALVSPSFCVRCSQDTEDRFVVVSDAIGSCISTSVSLGAWPHALVPRTKAACFAVSHFTMALVGILPSAVLGIEEAKHRMEFLLRRLPPRDVGLHYRDQAASVALLPVYVAILLPPYLAFAWLVATATGEWRAR